MVKRSALAAVALTGIAAVSASAQTAEVRERAAVACVSVAPGVTAFKATTVEGQPGEHRIVLRKGEGEATYTVAARADGQMAAATRIAVEAGAGQGGAIAVVSRDGEVTSHKLPEGGGVFRIVKKADGTSTTEIVDVTEAKAALKAEDAKKYHVNRPKATKPVTDEAGAVYHTVTLSGHALAEGKVVECEKLVPAVKKIDQ